MRFDPDPSDSPSPLTVVRGFLGTALLLTTVGFVVLFFSTGHVDRELALTVGLLWVIWGMANDLIGRVFQPLLGFLGGQLLGGADSGPPVVIDLARETEMLEQLMANPPAVPHREIIAGIRLAEIYRMHQGDRAKSDALLARLRAKYPDARELRHEFVDS